MTNKTIILQVRVDLNEWVHLILQRFRTRTSPSNAFNDIPRKLIGGGSFSTAVVKSAYSTAPVFYNYGMIFFYINDFSLIIFYHLIWLDFELFGS